MSKSLIDRYLVSLEGDGSQAEDIVQEITKDIESGSVRLVEFVQNLGNYLTDDDAGIRAKSLSCISSVLLILPVSKLNQRQITMLSAFLSEKLDDEECAEEACQGLLAVMKMDHILPQSIKEIVLAIFTKVELKKHSQRYRYAVYQVISAAVEKHISVLQEFNDDFIKGFLQLVSGEKDPRNLILIFTLLHVISTSFKLDGFEEQIFDSGFCYFPITFRPPPDDPYGITADDLKMKLRLALVSSPKLAQFLIPSLIEKLTSSSLSVKQDVILTLTESCESFGPLVMGQYWDRVFNAVKFEVLHDGEEDIPELVCRLLKQMAVILSAGQSRISSESTIGMFINSAVNELVPLMKDLSSRQAKPAAMILAAIAESSYICFEAIGSNSIKPLLELINANASATLLDEKLVLEMLILFIEASGHLYGSKVDSVRVTDRQSGLLQYKDDILASFSRAYASAPEDEVSFRLVALNGLVRLATLQSLLDVNEFGIVVQFLDDTILTSPSEALCAGSLIALQSFGKINPNVIIDVVFPTFLAQLPDSTIESTAVSERKHYRTILSALADLCIDKGVFDTLIVRLLNRITLSGLPEGEDEIYMQSILSTILLVLQRKSSQPGWDMSYFGENLMGQLLTLSTISSLGLGDHRYKALSLPGPAAATSRIMNLLVRSMTADQQQQFVKQLFNLYVHVQESSLISEPYREQVKMKFSPLTSDSMQGTLEILSSSVAGLQRTICIPVSDLNVFVDELVQLMRTTKSASDRLALLRLITLLINKWMSSELDLKVFGHTIKSLLSSIGDSSTELRDKVESLEILAWIIKAMVLKGNRQVYEIIEKVILLLPNAEIGVYASKVCGIMIADDEIVSKPNSVIVRLLAKQQYFNFIVGKLSDGFNRSLNSSVQKNYLIALSAVLQYMPGKIVVPHLAVFLPLLLKSLTVDDIQVKLAAIETINMTMGDATDLMTQHLNSIVPVLLKISTTAESGTSNSGTQVRVAALAALELFTKSIGKEELRPYQQEILRNLAIALDDKKRTVRKAAVDCRQAYFALE
ncbi:Dos2-interacting transcription regulator of RNA-Pol-II-domain-containing protein [Lipomyces oligophaga]|uniref:Dos2-interacting transcription regulator of RNA-Pol-II-domain-containing protein n=1 Tax=Lipomyces oligophaga TaxID=45792 RepID=UPI0034CFC34D